MLYRSRGPRPDISRAVASSRDRGVGGRSRGARPRVGERRRHTRTVSRRAARLSQTNARRPHHRPDGLSREKNKTVGTRTIPRATTRREFDPKTENDRALFHPTTDDSSAPPQTTTTELELPSRASGSSRIATTKVWEHSNSMSGAWTLEPPPLREWTSKRPPDDGTRTT